MSNQKSNIENTVIVYSLKIHSQLQIRGIPFLCSMPNPKNEKYTCWVYEKNADFSKAFNEIVESGGKHYGEN